MHMHVRVHVYEQRTTNKYKVSYGIFFRLSAPPPTLTVPRLLCMKVTLEIFTEFLFNLTLAEPTTAVTDGIFAAVLLLPSVN